MAKKLLNERTVRRFQKLAMVSPINEMYHKRDEEEMEEGMYAKRDEEEVMKEEEEAPEAPEAPEMEMGAEEGGMDGDLELTDEEAQAIIDLGSKLSAAMGDEEPEMDMGDEPMDIGGEDAPEDEELMEDDLMEALSGINYVPSQTEVVNEVAKRVARRLKAAKLHEAKLNRALGRK
tara:strand:+ start:19 stop:546 length:528 start_codon:yes stop_codon:yes gene_type:complete